MMCTTSYTPNPSQIITSFVDSVQYQMTLLTLVTHILISSPSIKLLYTSRNIVRQPQTNHQTMLLTLANLALKRYHPIWYTSSDIPSPATPTYQVILSSDPSSLARVSPVPPRSRHSPSTHHMLSTSQLLLPTLIYDEASRRHTSTSLSQQHPSICP